MCLNIGYNAKQNFIRSSKKFGEFFSIPSEVFIKKFPIKFPLSISKQLWEFKRDLKINWSKSKFKTGVEFRKLLVLHSEKKSVKTNQKFKDWLQCWSSYQTLLTISCISYYVTNDEYVKISGHSLTNELSFTFEMSLNFEILFRYNATIVHFGPIYSMGGQCWGLKRCT